MMFTKFSVRAATFAVTLAVASAIAPKVIAADDYPQKPVTMIVAYSPGGGTDTAARLLAKYVEPYLGQKLIIENKPGAGGQIGFTNLAQSRNDGYKIGFVNVPSIFMVKMLRDNVPYEMADFEAIANIQLDPVVLAVKADSPYTTFAEFMAAAEKNPGQVNVGGDGPQSNNQLQLVVAEDKLGIDVNFVPFSGSSPAITAALGDQVAAVIPSASSAANHVKNGRLRVLAVFADQRYAYLPDVPTVQEATGIDVPSIGASMRGVAAPKGLPEAEKNALKKAFAEVMQDKKFADNAEKLGMPLNYMTSEEFDRYLKKTEASVKDYIPLLK